MKMIIKKLSQTRKASEDMENTVLSGASGDSNHLNTFSMIILKNIKIESLDQPTLTARRCKTRR